jgi:hypothetical protein
MDLVDRYLQAVKFWLPKNQKDDIVAELAEDIQAQIEEREGSLGRRLNEEEVEAILREHGNPMLVANRFLPPQYLIGPVLFPIYRFVLKIVALCYLVPWLLVWICLAASGVTRVGSVWGSFWTGAFFSVGTVTLVFAVMERTQTKPRWLENWSPRKLPPVRNPNRIPRSGSAIELAVNLVFLTWWAANMSSPVVLDRADVRITLADSWPYFFWAFLALAAGNIVLAGVNLMRPYATVRRAALRLLSDAAGSAVFCFLLKANILKGLALANVPPPRAAEVINSINHWAGRILPLAVVAGVAIVTSNAFRIFRVKERKEGLVREAATL